MRKLTFAQATLEAMAEEMNKDEKVFARAAFSGSLRAWHSNSPAE